MSYVKGSLQSTDDESYISSSEEEWNSSFKDGYFDTKHNCDNYYEICIFYLRQLCEQHTGKDSDYESDDQTSSTYRVSNLYDCDSSDSYDSYSVTDSSDTEAIYCVDLIEQALSVMESFVRNDLCSDGATTNVPNKAHVDKTEGRSYAQDTIMLKSYRGHIPINLHKRQNTEETFSPEVMKSMTTGGLKTTISAMPPPAQLPETDLYVKIQPYWNKIIFRQYMAAPYQSIKRKHRIVPELSRNDESQRHRTRTNFLKQAVLKLTRKAICLFHHNSGYIILEDDTEASI